MSAVAAATSPAVRARCTTQRPQRRAAICRVQHYVRSALVVRASQQQEVVGTGGDAGGAAARGPAAGDAAAAKYLSLLPPFFSRPTQLEEKFGAGLWGLAQPFNLLGIDIRLRMTAARLPDGSLLLISPVAPTAELLGHVAALGGAVRHIIVPSSSPEHWMFAPALSKAFPEASVWVPPGFLEGRGLPIPFFQQIIGSMRSCCRVLGMDLLPPELQGQVESELLAAPFFLELAVVLPQYRVLLLSDTGFCMSAEEYGGISPANISAARGVGVWDRLGPITKQVFEGSPKEGRAWVEAVLAREDWDTVIPGHATAPILDGKRAFKDCYDFLY